MDDFGRKTRCVLLLVLISLLCLTACQTDSPTTTLTNDQDGQRTIFSAADATAGNVVYGDVVAVSAYWTPTQAQVAALENDLAAYFAEEGSDLTEKLWLYNAQFAGYEKGGKQFIYANYYCSNVLDDVMQWVFVLDGGTCFFQAQYDIDSQTFERVSINGSA